MAADQVRHHVLLQPVLAVECVEASTKRVVNRPRRLAHDREHRIAHVLGRQAQLAAHVVLQQLAQKLVAGVGHGVVKADAAPHKDLLHAGQMAKIAKQRRVAAFVHHHVAAHRGPKAATVLAYAVLELLVASGAEEVRRGAAHVVDVALELGVARQLARLADDAVVAAGLQHAPLVKRERAERALAKAPAVGRYGELYLGKRGHAARRIVVRMPVARVGQLVDLVHLCFREDGRRRVLHHVHPVGIGLHQALCRDGVHVAVLHVEAAGICQAVGFELVPRGKQLVIKDLVERSLARGAVDRAVHVGDLVHGQAGVQGVGDLHHCMLAHAVDQKVRAGVEKDGALEFIRPVIVVGQAAQARLDASDDEGRVLVDAANQVAVDRDRVVGTRASDAAGGVGVRVPAVLGDRVVVDHGVHVAGGREKAQARLAQDLDACGVAPVGLADDAHAVTVCLEHSGDDGHAKAGVVHIGISADVDKVALIPAAGFHVRAGHG